MERDPRLASARSRTRAAEGALAAAAVAPNPELEAEVGRGRAREGSATRTEWGLALSLSLDWLVRRGPELAAARAGIEESKAETQALRGDVLAELWRLHVRAGHAQAELATLEATEQQVETLARLVRRRVEAGEARPVEIPRIDVELERVRAEVAAARATREAALAQLGAWLGVRVERVELPSLPAGDPVFAGSDLSKHPRVVAAQARASAARAGASATRRSRFPALNVGGFYASELDREAVGGRVTVEVPLWDWKSGQVQRAEAEAASERSRAEAAQRAVQAELSEAIGACQAASGAADRQASSILPRAEEAARTLERAFQLGEAGLLEVIDARRVLLDARRQLITSARERDVNCGALILLSGRELP